MKFDDLMQTLPQELQDLVFGHVITLELGDVRPTKPGYKCPPGLHLNKALRTVTAKEYYGKKHTFHFCYNNHTDRSFRRWISSLTAEHRSLIGKVHIHAGLFGPLHIWGWSTAQSQVEVVRKLGLPMQAALRVDWYGINGHGVGQTDNKAPNFLDDFPAGVVSWKTGNEC